MLFNLSPIYFACKSSNHKLFRNRKISPDTNLQKIYTNIKHKIFEELVPSVLPLLKKKKHLRLGHAGIMDHSVDLSIPDFKKVSTTTTKKEWTEAIIKNIYINIYKCITANTSAIWQHDTHTTDQLNFFS